MPKSAVRMFILSAAIAVTLAGADGRGQNTNVPPLSSAEVDQVVDRLRAAVEDYVFPDVASQLQVMIDRERGEYRRLASPTALAERLAMMRLVNGTDALILDLRRNGGGSGDTEATLVSYFFDDTLQLSSVVEHTTGTSHERQHWTTPYLQGPPYLGKPVWILTSMRTHSAAEVLSYDLKNMQRARTVGERTSGDATSSNGLIDLGHRLSAFIPNGQRRSPITNSSFFQTGVQPDVSVAPAEALSVAYGLALKEATSSVESDELKMEREAAMKDLNSALLEEVGGIIRR